jgi:type III restriction enzyme
MGVRAFGTQLLCEQVVGRGLRRVSYEVDPQTGFFPVEYAEVLGVPFSFAQSGGGGPPPPPPRVMRVRALEERRKEREIRFPNVEGYRIVFPRTPLQPEFTDDSHMELTPDDVPNVTESEPLIGEGITFDLRKDAEKLRLKSVVFDVAGLLLREKFPDQVWRYPELVQITERWFDKCLTTRGKTPKQYLKWRPLAMRAVDRIYRALVGSLTEPADGSRGQLLPIINPLNPEGSTRHVDFVTSKQTLIPAVASTTCRAARCWAGPVRSTACATCAASRRISMAGRSLVATDGISAACFRIFASRKTTKTAPVICMGRAGRSRSPI